MLLSRIVSASEDRLTGRIALGLAGTTLAVSCFWLAFTAVAQPAYALMFGVFGLLGIYLVGRAVFSKSPRARKILLAQFFSPIGVIFIALAMLVVSSGRSIAGKKRSWTSSSGSL